MPSTDTHCTACAYLLRGLGERGRCPECGTRFDHTRVERPRPKPSDFRQLVLAWERLGPSPRVLTIAVLIIGLSAVSIWFAWTSVQRIGHMLGAW